MASLECWHDWLLNRSSPYCRHGVGLAGRENCFHQSDKSTGYVGEGLHPKTLNYMYAKLTDPYMTILCNANGGLLFSMSIYLSRGLVDHISSPQG